MSIGGGGMGAVTVGQIVRRNFDASFHAIQEHEQAAREHREELNATEAVGRLQEECDELKLYVSCLVSLLIRKKVVTKEEFHKLADIIDCADGVRDGRFSGSIRKDGTLSAESVYNDRRLRELAQAVQSMR